MSRLAYLFDLTGRTALVTGGNAGIGLALARALGLAGARLVLVARRDGVLDEAARSLRHDGLVAGTIAADLALANEPDRVVDLARGLAPPIDILVNAAGINLRRPFGDVTTEELDRQGRHRAADAGDRRAMVAARHHLQCHRARLLSHRPDGAPLLRSAAQRRARGAHRDRPQRPPGGPPRRRRLPRLRGVGLHYESDAVRRRRLFGKVTQMKALLYTGPH